MQKKLSVWSTARLNFVDNSKIVTTDLGNECQEKYVESSLLDSFVRWAKIRIKIENDYLALERKELTLLLNKVELEKLICTHKEEILKNIATMSDTELKNLLSSRISKENVEDVFNTLSNMTIGQIRKLDIGVIENKIKETTNLLNINAENIKNPIPKIIKTIEEL